MIGRIWRSAVVFCLLAALAAFFVAGGGMAAAVLGGGFLIGVSFHTLEGGVSALVAAAAGGRTRSGRRWATVVRIAIRYALLGFLAYVMIARLRLHPIGLIVGASSITAAAVVEAVRLLSQKPS